MSEIKIKRNHRMIYIMNYLTEHPNERVSLSYFAEYFQTAKSSISEDIDFVRDVLQYHQIGNIVTHAGVSGGVVFQPNMSKDKIMSIMDEILAAMREGKRILPGNYIYVTDILQNPLLLEQIATLITMRYQQQPIDAVMTIETKGIGLAVAVARLLNVPYVVVRHEPSGTEGATVSVNYVAGSLQTINRMELTKSSLSKGDNVLIVDDFLRNGGTINGLISMLEEFDCNLAGICVFAENHNHHKPAIPPYTSLVKVAIAYDEEIKKLALQIENGNLIGDLMV